MSPGKSLLEPGLLREWDTALSNMNRMGRERLRSIGVTLEAEARCGFVGCERIAVTGNTYHPDPAGFPALLLGCWAGDIPGPYARRGDFVLADIVAFRSTAPNQWWRRINTPFAVLGLEHLHLAHASGQPITLHPTPLGWLRAEGCGAVLLEWLEACGAVEAADLEVAA